MNKALTIILSVLAIVFLIGIVSANTLVAGKIYDTNYNNVVSGANVLVICNRNPISTTSLDDGTYAVVFETCKEGDSIHVSASKENLIGESDGIIIQNENQSESDYISIVNLIIKPIPTSSSSSSGGGGNWDYMYYKCGNEKCDTGETIKTCPKDCKANNTELLITNTNKIPETNSTKTDSASDENKEQPENSGITGAVIGFTKTKTGIVFIFAILIILAAMGIIALRTR